MYRRLLAVLVALICLVAVGCGSTHRSISIAPIQQTGIDLSNNDPSFGQWSTIRKHESFVYFKVNEGTGFIDHTAAQMAREARAAGLLVGGYDFQHVCGANPVAEARTFINAARADRLLSGPGVLPPTADFELSFGVCNASAWLRAWSNEVRKFAKDDVYSDPGFFVPEVGCFSDADYGWVADLGGFVPLCGLHTVFHQYSWAAWDGVAHVDGDVFLGSYAQLQALASQTPAKPAHVQPTKPQLTKRILELRADLTRHHCRTIHGKRAFRLCPRWAREGKEAHRALKS
jgi:GH25 family lysozyme M1 (1,4-beta-N-acetylmuramidase)